MSQSPSFFQSTQSLIIPFSISRVSSQILSRHVDDFTLVSAFLLGFNCSFNLALSSVNQRQAKRKKVFHQVLAHQDQGCSPKFRLVFRPLSQSSTWAVSVAALPSHGGSDLGQTQNTNRDRAGSMTN